MHQISVLLVHRHQILVDSLAESLGQQPGILPRAKTDCPNRALDILRRQAIDVVLLGVGPRDRAPHFVRAVWETMPEVKVLLFGTLDRQHILELLEAGACGHLSQDAPLEELCRAIQQIHHNRAPCCPEVVAAVLDRLEELSEAQPTALDSRDGLRLESLTTKESEVLGLVAKGCSNREIGQRLEISLSTVKMHVHHLLKKLGVHKRRDAVRVATELGLLPL